jgi:hypothetical protein
LGYTRQVIESYTHLLQQLDEADTVRVFRVRRNRFEAACHRNEVEIALEDFEFLWQNSERAWNPPMLRAVLLIGFMNLDSRNLGCVPLLKALYNCSWLPDQVRDLIAIKTRQVMMVQTIWRAARQGNFPSP